MPLGVRRCYRLGLEVRESACASWRNGISDCRAAWLNPPGLTGFLFFFGATFPGSSSPEPCFADYSVPAPSRQAVTDWTRAQQPGFRSLNYVLNGFYRKKSGPRTPRPPGGPPFLGMLAWSAEGLPSTRRWSFRWPLPLTSPPQVLPKAMRAASWPWWWFLGVGWHQRYGDWHLQH
jgi:hypothetical protein